MHLPSQETLTNVSAAGAIVSPWWLPDLHNISVVAAEIAPIIGVIWLVVQIISKIRDEARKP